MSHMMVGLHGAALMCVVLIPVPILAQQPDSVGRPSTTVTGGLGVSYAGVGVLGELHLPQRKLSALVGVGGLPETDATSGWFGAALGMRRYGPGLATRLYLEGMVAYLVRAGGEVYGPAVLVGFAHIAPSGFTFTAGVGAGRRTDNAVGLALNIGFGATWVRS